MNMSIPKKLISLKIFNKREKTSWIIKTIFKAYIPDFAFVIVFM